MKTILIEPQNTALALAEAVTNAIGEAFGVEPAEDGAVYPFEGAGIGFKGYAANQSYIGIDVTNGITSNKPAYSYFETFNAESTYAVDVLESSDRTAVFAGVRRADTARFPMAAIVQSETGEYVGFSPGLNTLTSVRRIDTSVKTWAERTPATAPAYSLVKYPDFHGGAMFKELYLMLSAPQFPAAGINIYANGKTFALLCAQNGVVLAMPVGEG